MKRIFFRNLFFSLFCMLSLAAVVSCSGDDEATDRITVTPEELFFESAVASDTLDVASSGEWVVAGAPSWIHTEPLQVDGGGKLVITVSENSAVEERAAVLSLTCGDAMATVTVTQYGYIETDYVDLGLSVKWACCNVGAKSPEEYGGYYAWGETEEKSDYSWQTYKWCEGTSYSMTKYCTDSDYGRVDNKRTLDPEDDVAHVKWGGKWRMPTFGEIKELVDKCKWEWTTLNGVDGRKVTGPNGNSIFLPAAGYRDGTEVNNRGSYSVYWSCSSYSNYSDCACHLHFGSSMYDSDIGYLRYCGHSVRPVSE